MKSKALRKAINTYCMQFGLQLTAITYVAAAAFEGELMPLTAVVTAAGLVFGMRNTVTRLLHYINIAEETSCKGE